MVHWGAHKHNTKMLFILQNNNGADSAIVQWEVQWERQHRVHNKSEAYNITIGKLGMVLAACV